MTAATLASYLLYVWVLAGPTPNYTPQLIGGYASQTACQIAGEAIKTTTLQTAYDSEKPGSKKLYYRYLCVASGN
jgi:hypothetical protein